MPVTVTSFFVKANPLIPFLLQDVDLRGGMRVVPDASHLLPISQNPNAILMGARVPGMLVVTADTMHVHQLNTSGQFIDRGILGSGTGSFKDIAYPLMLNDDNDLTVDPSALLPEGGRYGDILRIDASGKPYWSQLEASPDVGVRTVVTHSISNPIDPSAHVDFELPMGRTNLMIDVRTDTPLIQIEAYGTPARNETNPYIFRSRADQMFDDGSSLLADGATRYSRRVSFVANREDPVAQIIYWRITNQGNLPARPTVTIIFTALE